MAARSGVAVLAIALAIAVVYWPGLYGFWGRDDFMQLAFARLIGSPWPLFAHDHYFPVPGSVFRPLGFASFWLWQALFGTDYFAHAFADMLLHVAVALALYRVIRAGGLDRAGAVLCALVFALHPAVLGTALWWSARFDLLATLFSLIALRAAFDHAERPRVRTLALVLAATLAALLSKEISLAAVAAIVLVWIMAARRNADFRADASRGVLALIAVVAVFFAWRTMVLGTAGSGLAGDVSLPMAIAEGFLGWCRNAIGYVSFWPRLVAFARLVVALFVLALAILIGVVWKRRRMAPAEWGDTVLVISGLCLFVLPALLQAPVAALNAAPLGAEVSAVEAAMQSRLYYLGIAGLATLLAVPVRLIGTRWPVVVALAIVVCALGWTSRQSATEYAMRTVEQKPFAVAAAAAIDGLALPSPACHIVMLGAKPPPEWSIYVSMDSIVKALSKDPERIAHCFVHADYPTFYNLMDRSALPDAAIPYQPHVARGQPVPWLRIGDLVVAYLDAPLQLDLRELRGVMFLRWDGDRFRNVTDDVVAGRHRVELR